MGPWPKVGHPKGRELPRWRPTVEQSQPPEEEGTIAVADQEPHPVVPGDEDAKHGFHVRVPRLMSLPCKERKAMGRGPNCQPEFLGIHRNGQSLMDRGP